MGKAHRFDAETVSITVNLFDRVLSIAFVPSELLQGSALACMLLASKLHERQPLALCDMSSLAGMSDPQKTINDLEMKVLSLLRYDLNAFTATTCVSTVLSCLSGPGAAAILETAHVLALLSMKSAAAAARGARCAGCFKAPFLHALLAPPPPPTLTPPLLLLQATIFYSSLPSRLLLA